MYSLNEVLLPTDFSPRSTDLARYAAGAARRFNSKITLLHVLPPINPAWAAMENGVLVQEVLDHQKEETANRLSLFLTEELWDVPVERVVLQGDPAEVITAYCASNHVELVMMPTRGYTSFRRYLLGSVTAKVLHDVCCPVWTSSHLADGHATVSVLPKVIVCAVDSTPAGDGILQWATCLASDLQARLIVAHAIPSLEFHPETYFLEADMRKALIGDAHAKISKVLQSSRIPGAEVRVEGGSVATVVRSVAEDNRADLLVIGRSSAGGMLGRLRTHSYALIRESPCPVISV
jgi:nucleotide-binding universal stress UspA family protein